MCDVQYWKSNNICNIWKIKEKLKILMTCDDLSFINTRQKTLKPSEKVFQFPGWMRKNFMPGNCSWRASAETWDASCFIEKHIFSELNRCIFQISLKYIKLVIPKILFILVLCNFNFYFKLRDPPSPPPTQKNKFLTLKFLIPPKLEKYGINKAWQTLFGQTFCQHNL